MVKLTEEEKLLKIREYRKNYYQKNKARIAEYQRRYYLRKKGLPEDYTLNWRGKKQIGMVVKFGSFVISFD
jgi:hypothetical protein